MCEFKLSVFGSCVRNGDSNRLFIDFSNIVVVREDDRDLRLSLTRGFVRFDIFRFYLKKSLCFFIGF